MRSGKLKLIAINDHPEEEDALLRSGFRAVRDRYDGTNPDEADATLRRALVHTRLQDRRRRFTRWVVLPIAAVLAASTAWAAGTGRLSPALDSLVETFHPEHEPRRGPAVNAGAPGAAKTVTNENEEPATAPTAPVETAPSAPETASAPPISATPAEAPPIAAAPPPARSAAASKTNGGQRSKASPSSTSDSVAANTAPTATATASHAPEPATSAELAADPNGPLFAEAHRIHFVEKNPARALAAWDRYLAAAPAGRFAPEARYNRAIALIRLHRKDAAKNELAAFANGWYGSYRREEARALLQALEQERE